LKTLLINPANGLQAIPLYRRFLVPPIPPLNLVYLAASAEASGHRADVYDQFLEGTDNAALVARILAGGYDAVGLSCLTPSHDMVCDLGRRLRAAGFAGAIVLGNTHAHVFADALLAEGWCDAVVHGEGEETFAALLDAWSNQGRDGLANVTGLSFRRDGTTVRNPDRPPLPDLDRLPYPAWHKVDLDRYLYFPSLFLYGERMLPVQASRGCRYCCYMCAQDAALRRYRRRSPAAVVAELSAHHQRHGVRHFVFLDGYFPPDAAWGWEFVERLRLEYGRSPINFQFETRADMVDERLYAALIECGCRHIWLGFESASDETLRRIGKHTTAAQGREAMRVLRRLNVATTGFFIIGFPWEDDAAVKQTIRYGIELRPDLLKFSVATPLPGSPWFDEISRVAPFRPDFARMGAWAGFLEPRRDDQPSYSLVPAKVLAKRQLWGLLRHYVRPRVLLRHARLGSFSPRALAGLALLGLKFFEGAISSAFSRKRAN